MACSTGPPQQGPHRTTSHDRRHRPRTHAARTPRPGRGDWRDLARPPHQRLPPRTRTRHRGPRPRRRRPHPPRRAIGTVHHSSGTIRKITVSVPRGTFFLTNDFLAKLSFRLERLKEPRSGVTSF